MSNKFRFVMFCLSATALIGALVAIANTISIAPQINTPGDVLVALVFLTSTWSKLIMWFGAIGGIGGMVWCLIDWLETQTGQSQMRPETITRIGESRYNNRIEWVEVFTDGSLQATMVERGMLPPNPIGKRIYFAKTADGTCGTFKVVRIS